MNLEDRVDNYLRMYIQKDIPITREQADEINEYKCELRNRIDKAIEYIENHSLYKEEYDYDYEENIYLSGIDDETAKEELLEILKGESE